MDIWPISSSSAWTVVAIRRSDGSDVWQWLKSQKGNQHIDWMMDMLGGHIPINGTPRGKKSGSLGDGLWEIRKEAGRGPRLRVTYFYDEGKTVVCANGFWKDQPTMPGRVAEAKQLQAAYKLAKQQENLTTLEKTEDEQ